MSSENIHIAGRYNKYCRNLSQSPWIDKNDIRIKHSVQELIEDGLNKYLEFGKSVFSSSGREDVDVRMLGRGRPFVFKIVEPRRLESFSPVVLAKIQDYINNKYTGLIRVRDLQVVDKVGVAKHIKNGEEIKTKLYRALCCCSRSLTEDDIKRVNCSKNLTINQRTPIRVLHRRVLTVRQRLIHEMRIEPPNLGDFELFKPNHADRLFTLTLLTDAGTYIKEFVHGDFGRTKPSIHDILGCCETDLVELDVMEVSLDWPPTLTDRSLAPIGNSEHLDMDICQLFTAAKDKLHEAEQLPRGPARQEALANSKKLFEESSALVDSLSLFSPNETIEDIATKDLRYLSIPAQLAKVLTLTECGSDRLKYFTEAERYLISFLELMSRLGLVEADETRALLETNISVSFEHPTRPISLESAMKNRDDKIKRYKKIKLIQDEMNALEKIIHKGGTIDDEIYRKYHLHMLKTLIEESIDCLQHEVRPAIMLEQYPRPIREDVAQESSTVTKSTFTIVRDDLQKQVFGLGYPSRPTVTVDEFISKKILDGDLAFDKHKEIYSNSLQRYAEQPNLRREQEEQSDAEREDKEDRHDDEELKRKRNWDEFTDDNPRGSGNRHNMG